MSYKIAVIHKPDKKFGDVSDNNWAAECSLRDYDSRFRSYAYGPELRTFSYTSPRLSVESDDDYALRLRQGLGRIVAEAIAAGVSE